MTVSTLKTSKTLSICIYYFGYNNEKEKKLYSQGSNQKVCLSACNTLQTTRENHEWSILYEYDRFKINKQKYSKNTQEKERPTLHQ